MKFTIQVLIESPDALPLSVPIDALDRTGRNVEDVGLRLDEAKAILHGLQEQLIRQQLAGYLDAHRPCPYLPSGAGESMSQTPRASLI
jgi:hypothetical protein